VWREPCWKGGFFCNERSSRDRCFIRRRILYAVGRSLSEIPVVEGTSGRDVFVRLMHRCARGVPGIPEHLHAAGEETSSGRSDISALVISSAVVGYPDPPQWANQSRSVRNRISSPGISRLAKAGQQCRAGSSSPSTVCSSQRRQTAVTEL
jgi:hypothetical protein